MRNHLTAASLELFLALAHDAGNWSGTPLIDVTPAERGNLTQLKKQGLLQTFRSDGHDFAEFLPAGKTLAAEHGINI